MAKRGQQALFIGYRREDTGGDAGRLYDRLATAFGRERVFKDVDSIPRGVRFRAYVEDILGGCRMMLVLIGPKWIDARDAEGNRRLEDPEDLVRVEIETALANPKVQVLPVLVNGAEMPKRDQLPGELKALTEFNAARLRHDPDFHNDINDLITVIETGATVRRRNPMIPILLVSVLVLGALGAGGYWWVTENPLGDAAMEAKPEQEVASTTPATTPQSQAPAPVQQRTEPVEPPRPQPTAVSGTWSGSYQCPSSIRSEGTTRYTFETSGGRITSATETFQRGALLSGATNFDVESQSDDGRRFTLRTSQWGGFSVDFRLSEDGSTLNGTYNGHSSCTTVRLRRN